MRADQVAVVDVGVIEVAVGLHLRLNRLHHFALAEHLVVDLDAGDFLERLGQRLRFIVMRRDRLRQHVDFHALERLGGLDEPLHLLDLLFFATASEGWNSLSTHFFAASMSANARPTQPPARAPHTATSMLFFMVSSLKMTLQRLHATSEAKRMSIENFAHRIRQAKEFEFMTKLHVPAAAIAGALDMNKVERMDDGPLIAAPADIVALARQKGG